MQTSAQALLAELQAPIKCDPADTLCFSEVLQKRFDAATAGLQSIIRIDKEREGIVDDLNTRIAIRGGIIDDLQKVDKNSQKIDSNQIENARLYEAQLADFRQRIGDLQHRLDSCQATQKYIAAGAALVGGFIGYKIRGSSVNPFAAFAPTSALNTQAYPLSLYQTDTEKLIRRALSSRK